MTPNQKFLPPRLSRRMVRQRRKKIAITALLLTAVVGAGMFLLSPPADAVSSDQGWNEQERLSWYRGTQGSRMIPRSWFEAVERAEDDTLFAEDLERYGFVPAPAFDTSPWPVGFAVDRQDDSNFRVTGLRWYADQPSDERNAEPWVGLNCSACHTARIRVGDRARIVDGAPGMLDFQAFVDGMDAAILTTRDTPEKWERFAARVLDGRDTPDNRAMLRGAVDQFVHWQATTRNLNESPLRYGYGRLDAVGHILNKVQMFSGSENPIPSPANAPVSIPYLWNIWRQEQVQWNGIARNSRFALPGDNFEYGALGRNTGEVLGVFGEVLVTPHEGGSDLIKGYESSVRVENLMRMEVLLQKLQPPAWPADAPLIDEALAQNGQPIYQELCASCHLLPEDQVEDQPTERMALFTETSPENQTDIWMACNAWAYAAPTGLLEGTPDIDMQPLPDVAPLSTMLATTVRGTILGHKADLVRAGFANFFGLRRLPDIDRAPEPGDPLAGIRRACLTTPDVPILAYKARPLDGIWATAPYLHNGSVPNLAQLLLPADQRQSEFMTGDIALDTEQVGYFTDDASPRSFLLRTSDDEGRVIEGNSNAGHDYGVAQLSDDERLALLEFLKTL